MPRYAPYRIHPFTSHTQSYRKGTNCVPGTHHALFVFELHTKYNMCVHTLQASSTKYVLLHYPSDLVSMYRWPSMSTDRSRGGQIPTPPQKRKEETKRRKKCSGVVRSVIQKKKIHSSISDKSTPPSSALSTKSAHEPPNNPTKHRKKNTWNNHRMGRSCVPI